MVGEKKYNSIKLKASKILIYNKLTQQKRSVETCSMDNAKTIGVTFASKVPEDTTQVRKILKTLSGIGKQTFALGYIIEKKTDDFYLNTQNFNFFSDKDLDFMLRPKNETAIEFQKADFDILIDLGTEQYYPMEILLHKSKAKFKVGRDCSNSPFDFMINCEKSKGTEYYFSQVLHYLSNLKY